MSLKVGDLVHAKGPGAGSVILGEIASIDHKFEGKRLKGGRKGEPLLWVRFADGPRGEYPRWESEVTS